MPSFCLSDLQAPAATFRKDLSSESDRVETLLGDLDRTMRAAFLEFIRACTSEALLREIGDRLAVSDVQGAIDLLGDHIASLGNVIPKMMQDAAEQEVAAMVEQIRPFQPSVGVSFDPTNPQAAALMRANRLEFIQSLTDSQAAATRAALAEGLDTGRGLIATARAFRDSIGLAESQVRAVANYRRLLHANSRQALDRVLRDRRYDRSVENAIESGEPLSAEKIDRMTERYRTRMLANRAETISRTESVKILSESQDQAFAQVMMAANLSPEQVEQTWMTVLDGRERATHHAMHGQRVAYGASFQSPSGALLRYPGDPSASPAEIINCRCRRVFRILPPVARALAA